MRTINYTKQFKRNYKCEKQSSRHHSLDTLFLPIVSQLIVDISLPKRCHDHPLSGERKDHRDYHIKPALVLIYRKPDSKTLELVRLESHSEFGL